MSKNPFDAQYSSYKRVFEAVHDTFADESPITMAMVGACLAVDYAISHGIPFSKFIRGVQDMYSSRTRQLIELMTDEKAVAKAKSALNDKLAN